MGIQKKLLLNSVAFVSVRILPVQMGQYSFGSPIRFSIYAQALYFIQGFLLEGDQFEIELDSKQQTSFRLNGSELLRSDDPELLAFLAQGWLGENASALLRDPLLSGKISSQLLQRFEELTPNAQRLQTVAAWSKQEPTPEPAPAPAPVPEPAPEAAAEAETPAPVIASEIASEPEPAPSPAPKAEPPASEEPETLPLPEPAGEPEMDVAAVEPASPVPAAPEPVTEAASNPQVDDREYQTQLRQYMRAALKSVFSEVRYPQRAVDKGIEGQVELLARVKLNGELEEVIMGKPSGYSMLDRAATDAVEKAAPFPALTATAQEEFRMENGEGYELLIPVYFRLRGPSS